MVMEAAPASALEVAEPDLLLELLIVALDAPAQLGEVDEAPQADVFGKGGEPVFGRLLPAFWPFDQKPFRCTRLAELEVAPRGAHPQASKARGQRRRHAFPPFNRLPRPVGQRERELLDRDRLMLGVAPQERRWTPPARPRLGRQRLSAFWPYGGVGENARHIDQAERRDP